MELTSAVEHIRPSVVQIRTMEGKPNTGTVFGTGFLVSDDGVFVTAGHVLMDAMQFIAECSPNKTLSLYVGFAVENYDTPEKQIRFIYSSGLVDPIAINPLFDLALLQLRTSVSAMPNVKFPVGESTSRMAAATLVDTRPLEGEAIATSGYPLDIPAMVTSTGCVGNSWYVEPETDTDRYIGDSTANPGNSGGPVYRLSDGAVIGVLVAGLTTGLVQGDGVFEDVVQIVPLSVIVPSMYIGDMLKGDCMKIERTEDDGFVFTVPPKYTTEVMKDGVSRMRRVETSGQFVFKSAE